MRAPNYTVRIVAFLLATFLVVVVQDGAAEAHGTYDPAVILLYGVALRSFNSGIDGREAVVWAEATIAEADRERLDARLLVALIAVESAWRSDAVSSAGAVGLGQLMPGTAAGLGVDAADPLENIHGAAVHLRGLLARYAGRPGNEQYVDALAAYNAGAGAVDRYGGVPPYAETREYVRRVMALWARLAGTRAKAAGWAEPEPVGSRGRRPLAPFRR